MIVFAVLGWIVLGLLALLVLALLLPATVRVQYSHEGLFVWARVLCLRLQVFPLALKPRAKRKKERPATKTEGEEDKPEEVKKEKSVEEKVALAKRLLHAGKAAARVMLRHVRIKAVQLVLPVHTEDASGTALLAGRVQGGIGALRAVLDGRLKIRFRCIQVIPDFTGQCGNELFLACKVVFNPVIMLKAGFVFLQKFRRKRFYSRAALKRAIEEKKARASGNNAA